VCNLQINFKVKRQSSRSQGHEMLRNKHGQTIASITKHLHGWNGTNSNWSHQDTSSSDKL